MIRIDLLPEELRRAERTSPGLFLATVGLVIVVCCAGFGVGWGYFGLLGSAEADVASAQETFDSRKPRADYSDRLEAEKKDYTARLDHIKDFSDSRILWTKKLDQLASVVDSPEAGRHTVWLESMTMKMTGGRNMGLNFKGQSESGEVRKVSYFHHDISTGSFFEDFESISNPTAKVVTDEDFDPAEACEFEFVLGLRDRTKDQKKKK